MVGGISDDQHVIPVGQEAASTSPTKLTPSPLGLTETAPSSSAGLSSVSDDAKPPMAKRQPLTDSAIDRGNRARATGRHIVFGRPGIANVLPLPLDGVVLIAQSDQLSVGASGCAAFHCLTPS
jgi:hypothetical protein